jgi:hypothetical protein
MGGLADMSAWMGALPNHLRLDEITMPGSHDAGVYRESMSKTGVIGSVLPKSLSACQDRSVLEQCEAGSRFFDIRLKASKTSIRAHHTTKGQGAIGESWDNTLESVSAFLDAHPSEFVILRLTKPTGGAKDEIVQTLVESSLKGNKLYKSPNFPNFAESTLQQLRGRAICVFDPSAFSVLHSTLGMHPFYRYEDGIHFGLITCGKYSDKKDIKKVIDGQVAKLDAHADHGGHHLFVLYWTQTGGSVESNTKSTKLEKERQKGRLSGGTHHNIEYLKFLIASGKDLHTGETKFAVTTHNSRRNVMPNVIMYDFVNATTSKEIVSLNEPGLRAHLV